MNRSSDTSGASALSPARVRVCSDVMVQPIGDERVLVHLGTNQIYELSSTASRLWELLEAGCTPRAAHAQLALEYDVAPSVLAAEVAETLAALKAARLLEEAAEGRGGAAPR